MSEPVDKVAPVCYLIIRNNKTHTKGEPMRNYVPDMTERFPDGDRYDRRDDDLDMMCFLESSAFDDREYAYEDRNYSRLYSE